LKVTATDFFPAGVLANRSSWYSKHLKGLQEPSLYPPSADAEIYRFTWLRTFDNPMAFRVTVTSNGTGTLTVKRANGAGGYDPGVVDLKLELTLTKSDVDKLKQALVDMSYWDLPIELDGLGIDGAQWIVEASVNGRYKVVDRWSQTDALVDAWCMRLITLSGVDVGKIY
jgi:hypothetical protein